MFPSSVRARLIVVVLIVIALGGLAAITGRTFLREERGSPDIVKTVDRGSADFVEIDGRIVEVDPMRGRVMMELAFTPHGRLDAGGGLLAVPLEIDVSSIGADPIEFAAERRMFPREVEIPVYTGSAADYPFDRHRLRVEVLVLEHTDDKGGRKRVPVEFDFSRFHHGYAVRDTQLADAEHGYVGYDVEFTRSRLVIGSVMFCLAVMWALAVINLLLLWAVITDRMVLEITLFGYMSGMIVALYFFRQILPDVPPFLGVLADYIAFFWSELITALVSVIFAVIWYRQLLKANRPGGGLGQGNVTRD